MRTKTTCSSTTRSRPSTSSTPIWRARKACSKYAELCTPGVSTTTVGSSPGGGGRDGAQRLEQRGAVVVDGADPVVGEGRRQHLRHRRAVLEHVADARRVAEVVLEHAVGAVGVAHEVDAGDEAAGAAGDRDAGRLAHEARRTTRRASAARCRRQGGPLADVEVVEEAVEGGDPLDEAGLDVRPTRRPG